MAKIVNIPDDKMLRTIVGSAPPPNKSETDTREQANDGLEAFIQDNGETIIEAVEVLQAEKPGD